MTDEQLNQALEYKAEIDRIDNLLCDIEHSYNQLKSDSTDEQITDFVKLILKHGYKDKLKFGLKEIWRIANARKQFLEKKIEEL